jgi:hypothetical protein
MFDIAAFDHEYPVLAHMQLCGQIDLIHAQLHADVGEFGSPRGTVASLGRIHL